MLRCHEKIQTPKAVLEDSNTFRGGVDNSEVLGSGNLNTLAITLSMELVLLIAVSAAVVSQVVPRIQASKWAANNKDRKTHNLEMCYLDYDAHGEPTIQNGYASKHKLAS